MAGSDPIAGLPPKGAQPVQSALIDGRIHLCDGLMVSVNRSWKVAPAPGNRPVAAFKAMAPLGFHGGDGADVYLAAVTFKDAFWIGLETAGQEFAAVIAIDGRNAVTGQPATGTLSRDPVNYLVLPDQPWLDALVNPDGNYHQLIPRFNNSETPGIGARIDLTAFRLADDALASDPNSDTDKVQPSYTTGHSDAGNAHHWQGRTLTKGTPPPEPCGRITVYLVTPDSFQHLTGTRLDPGQFIDRGKAPAPHDPFQ